MEDSFELGGIILTLTGVLTYRTLDEWVHQVNRLFRDPDLRISRGINAHNRVWGEYLQENILENLIE